MFSIPPVWEQDVQFLFLGVIAAFLLGTYRLIYSLVTFARNRIDLRGLLLPWGARFVQILIVVGLFNLDQSNLVYIDVALLAQHCSI
jgi:hypothetical protein